MKATGIAPADAWVWRVAVSITVHSSMGAFNLGSCMSSVSAPTRARLPRLMHESSLSEIIVKSNG